MTITTRMLRPYFQNAPVPTFLAGMFRTTAESYKNSEEVKWDIMREDEDVAVPIAGPGSHHNDLGDFDNKKIIPPRYAESASISASSLGRNRQVGENEYKDPGFLREAGERASMAATRLEKKIRRAMTIQASQILTTGQLALTDEDGEVVYTIDFEPKATHFTTASVAWDTATGAQKLGQLATVANAVRNDGLEDPVRMIFGDAAFDNLTSDDDILKRFDQKRADFGQLHPLKSGGTRGGHYRGTLDLENFKIDIWTSGEIYKDPQTGSKVRAVPEEKIITLADSRLETAFGRIFFLPNGQNTPIPELRRRAKMRKQGMDIFFNNWAEKNGSAVTIELSSRPILLPIAMDTFGCHDTGL